MELRVPRTCSTDDIANGKAPRPLSDFRHIGAYALLGEPGAGKTESFTQEAREPQCLYLTAREFRHRAIKPEWRDKALFLDGLDEMRAGTGDGRIPLEDICEKLQALGRPPFRISCREADWLGGIDQDILRAVAPGGAVQVLRLEPLCEQDITALAEEKLGAAQPDFIARARSAGLYGLLQNPYRLKLLLAALGSETWPASRSETFEKACRNLVVEGNRSHQVTAMGGEQPSTNALLDATGLLSACYLLGNLAGFALLRADADDLHPALAEIADATSLPVRTAIASALFKSDGDGLRAPDHRSSAEYLAARYLAGQVERPDRPLPWRRLLALVASSDGKPVAGLRGLWAWLASILIGEKRHYLVDADPVAVALYGDLSRWDIRDKRHVLEALRGEARRAPWLFGWQWELAPLGALASADMADPLREILAAPERDDAQQMLVDGVLEAIRYAEPLPQLADVLEDIVRDDSRWSGIRRLALHALLHTSPPCAANADSFRALLAELRQGKVVDADDALLGILLGAVFPRFVDAREIFDYLHSPKQTRSASLYEGFWSETLLRQCPVEAIPQLLDELVSRHEMRKQLQDEMFYKEMAGSLLLASLNTYTRTIESSRLYDWLAIGLDEFRFDQLHEHAAPLASWFSAHPEVSKVILAEGIRHADAAENLNAHFFFDWYARLYGAKLPDDLGLWILQQVETAPNREIGKALLQEGLRCLWQERGNAGLSLDVLMSWVEAHPDYRPALEEMLYWEIPEWRRDAIQRTQDRKEDRKRARAERLAHYRKYQSALKQGTAPIGLLDEIAMAYFGHFSDVPGQTPQERLRNLLSDEHAPGGYEDLVQAALAGLRASPLREGLPTVANIVRLSTEGRRHTISFPCLAGAEELSGDDPESLLVVGDETLEKLIAMQLTLGIERNPAWFSRLRRTRPELVAKVLVEYALLTLRARKPHIEGLYGLAHNEEFAAVAPIAVPQLLKGFPPRAPKEQLNSLEYLLKAGIRYLTTEDLLALVEAKLAQKSLEAGQRTLWLTAGLLAAPDAYQTRLEQHVGDNQERASQLVRFFPRHEDRQTFHQPVPVNTLGWLVGLLGARCAPYRLNEGVHSVSPSMALADTVRTLISRLGGIGNQKAADALKILSDRQSLAAWKNELRAAMHTQASVQREAAFQAPKPAEILRTLTNHEPSTPGDLAALTLDHLDELARHIRDGASNAYRKFWNLNSDGRTPSHSKHENDCRDMLLDDMAPRLMPHRVFVDKEGYFVEDKRADLVAKFQDWRLPIEIKKDSHADLWKSLRTQLIAQYTRGPDTGGYGIYLVLWFGGKGLPTSPSGRKPLDPAELTVQLTELLEQEERHRVVVRVIDCSWPSTPSRPPVGAKRSGTHGGK